MANSAINKHDPYNFVSIQVYYSNAGLFLSIPVVRVM